MVVSNGEAHANGIKPNGNKQVSAVLLQRGLALFGIRDLCHLARSLHTCGSSCGYDVLQLLLS